MGSLGHDHRAVDNFQATYDDATPETYWDKVLKELDFYNFAFHRRTFGYGFFGGLSAKRKC